MKKILSCAILSLSILHSAAAYAHGVVGNRVFPATLAIDDPSVSDEVTLPQVSNFNDGNGRITTTTVEFSKTLTEDLGVAVEGNYISQSQAAGGENGFDNFALSAKYQFYQNTFHETLLSMGVDWDIGETGSDRVGAEHFSTYTPQIFFGKGLGDLDDSLDYFKPLALTGVFGFAIPDDQSIDGTSNPDALSYGFTVQYSLPYLQQHVKDIGLIQPFANITPLVEFTFDTPVDGNNNHATTGTINPGFIWTGANTQFGVEAILPLNDASGDGVGIVGQMHFYLDDIFPNSLGKPLFSK